MIGGANEFQEYAWGYYGVKSQLNTSDVTKVCGKITLLLYSISSKLSAYVSFFLLSIQFQKPVSVIGVAKTVVVVP